MSDTDHPKLSRSDRTGNGERIRGVLYARPRRWHKLPSARDDIAEQLRHDSPVAAIVDRAQPRKKVRPTVRWSTPVRPVRPARPRPAPVTRHDYDHGEFREFCRSIPVTDVADDAPTPFMMARARQARLAS